jgi:hypothetical protein
MASEITSADALARALEEALAEMLRAGADETIAAKAGDGPGEALGPPDRGGGRGRSRRGRGGG